MSENVMRNYLDRERKVWVVGGTSGIGKMIGSRLLLSGFRVDGSGLETADVKYTDALKGFHQANGPYTDIIYSAGINHLDWSDHIDPLAAQTLFDVNVTGLIRVLQVAPEVKRVVVIGSDAAWRPMRTSVAYCASKAALHMAVQVIARERGGDDFSIVTVAPGKIEDTAMTEYVDRRSAELRPELDHIEYQKSQIPGGKFATTADVAEVVRNLLITETPYINGAVIQVNGGRS